MNSKRETEKLYRQFRSVRPKKVDKIKHRVMAGVYKIDSAKIAKSMFVG